MSSPKGLLQMTTVHWCPWSVKNQASIYRQIFTVSLQTLKSFRLGSHIGALSFNAFIVLENLTEGPRSNFGQISSLLWPSGCFRELARSKLTMLCMTFPRWFTIYPRPKCPNLKKAIQEIEKRSVIKLRLTLYLLAANVFSKRSISVTSHFVVVYIYSLFLCFP